MLNHRLPLEIIKKDFNYHHIFSIRQHQENVQSGCFVCFVSILVRVSFQLKLVLHD